MLPVVAAVGPALLTGARLLAPALGRFAVQHGPRLILALAASRGLHTLTVAAADRLRQPGSHGLLRLRLGPFELDAELNPAEPPPSA